MKICFTSTLSKSFLPGITVLLKSLLQHNPSLNIPYIIFNEGDLIQEDINQIKSIYNNIELRNINTSIYNNLKFSTVRNWKINPGHRLEIFTLQEYDKIIFLDTDMICRGNIDYLLQCNEDFAAVIDHPLIECEGGYEYIGFNAGLMIIGKKFLNKVYHEKALKLIRSKTWYGNQGTFNILFAPYAKPLPEEFLITTPYITRQKLKKAIFVHFVGEKKPWYSTHLKLEDNFDSFVVHNNRSISGWLDSTTRIIALKALIKEYKDYV